MCHKFKSLDKLPNGWTDWHHFGTHLQIHLGMDIRQTNCPSRHKRDTGGGGGLGVKHSKVPGKLSNGCTDWHHIWYTSADSSGNGHRLNTFRPTVPQGHFGGGGALVGHKFKCLGSSQTAGPIGTKLGTNLRIRL